jgi:hypothetical protein
MKNNKEKKQEELIAKILKASNEIANATRTGSGNFIICSLEVSDLINGVDKKEERKKKLKRLLEEYRDNNFADDK